jgi:hypothetical protein
MKLLVMFPSVSALDRFVAIHGVPELSTPSHCVRHILDVARKEGASIIKTWDKSNFTNVKAGW